MYKVKHELCPSYIRNIFSRQSNTYNLRQSDFYVTSFQYCHAWKNILLDF